MRKLRFLLLPVVLCDQTQHIDIIQAGNDHWDEQHGQIGQQIKPKYFILLPLLVDSSPDPALSHTLSPFQPGGRLPRPSGSTPPGSKPPDP